MAARNQTKPKLVNFVPTKLFVGFYLVPAVTPHCIEMGRVTALASDSGLEGGAGHAPEPPRLQTPHLSVYPAFFPSDKFSSYICFWNQPTRHDADTDTSM